MSAPNQSNSLAHPHPEILARNYLANSTDRVVFLHVPKTGGTTLSNLLQERVSPERVCPERFNELATWPAGRLATYHFFTGHFDQMSLRAIPGRVKVVTMLRKPKDRIVSVYKFWRAQSRAEALDAGAHQLLAAIDNDLLGFLRAVQEFSPDIVDNVYARAYGAYLPMADDSLTTRRMSLDALGGAGALVDRACAFLDECVAVGLLEQFDASVIRIFNALGLAAPKEPIKPLMRTIDIEQNNHTGTSAAGISWTTELEAEIAPLIRYDREIYNYAVSLLASRVI